MQARLKEGRDDEQRASGGNGPSGAPPGGPLNGNAADAGTGSRTRARIEFITDEKGILLGLSPVWEELTGFKAENALGRRLEHYVWPEDRHAFHRELQSLLRGEAGQVREPVRLLTRQGLPRWVELRAAASIESEDGKTDIVGTLVDAGCKEPESVLAHLDDLVESQVAEHEVAVEEAKQALDGFIHTVAHDLRAPLRAIQGYARRLQGAIDRDGMEDARDCVTRLGDTAARMAAMFDGLLRLSRTGNARLAVRTVDCAPLVRGVIADILQQPSKQVVTFAVDVRCTCEADPELLRQVFVNLIGNALKYSSGRATARIEVKARRERDETVFTVRDNGAGFDMAHAGKLFHVFQRLHARSQFEGCGVGLSIVRRIVERHGGRVWAEAVPGEGAAFHFSLPAAS